MNRAASTRACGRTAVAASLVALAAVLAAIGAGAAEDASTFSQAGVSVRFELEASAGGRAAGALREGDTAIARFRVTDASGTPLTGLRPNAWLDGRGAGGVPDEKQCHAKIQAFLQSDLAARPALDLNTYFVLALNDEGSISVLDPLRGFSTSKLLTLVLLPGPGEDWALAKDGRRLFVSLPAQGSVAVVSTESWRVEKTIPAGARPGRVALQPDGRYLWVGSLQPAPAADGLIVIDTQSLARVAELPSGGGPHDFAFTPDNRFAFASARGAGGVTLVDVRTLHAVQTVATGAQPVSVAFSTLANAAYVAHAGDGGVAVVDAERQAVTARIPLAPGLASLRFTADGRWGFAVNRKQGRVEVVDATANVLRHSVVVGGTPEEIAFGAAFAYVRSPQSTDVTMLNLAGLGTAQGPSLNEFPAGQAPQSDARAARATAPSLVPGLEPGAMLVANAADGFVYYYMEGMAAPMGSFSNYKRAPRAVLVADRSLRETSPGVYEAAIRLPASGTLDVPFLLGAPRVVHCFEASVAANPTLARAAGPAIRVEPLVKQPVAAAGSPLRLPLRVTDALTGEPRAGIADLRVVGTAAGGNWQTRQPAKAGEPGAYEAVLRLPRAGVYYVFWESASQRLRVQDQRPLVVRVISEAEESVSDGEKKDARP